jgi:hypothetical protein
LKAVASNLEKYNSGQKEVNWDKGGNEQADDYTIFLWK